MVFPAMGPKMFASYARLSVSVALALSLYRDAKPLPASAAILSCVVDMSMYCGCALATSIVTAEMSNALWVSISVNTEGIAVIEGLPLSAISGELLFFKIVARANISRLPAKHSHGSFELAPALTRLKSVS